MVTNIAHRFCLALLLMAGGSWAAQDRPIGQTLLIDDFQSGTGQAVFGTSWSGFSDRVMGGRSEINLAYQRLSDTSLSLRLSGPVRLDNNGGFIQARLPLEQSGQRFDASGWSGIEVTARAAPGAYYVHLRSRATWLPWQYYSAQIGFNDAERWQTHRIPFELFQAEATRSVLDVSSLKSVAIVAYGEAFDADIELKRLSFYREED